MWVGRDDEIQALRGAVPRKGLDAKREHIWTTQVLLGPGDGKKCCANWLKCVYGVRSNAKLYGGTRMKKERKDKKRISVISWFQELLQVADKMPDSPDSIIPAPSKKAVYNWYCSDVESSPKMYDQTSKTHFLKTWRDYFPGVKLRKYLRFTKCCTCVKWRQVRWSKQSTKEQKLEALDKLKTHYAYIKQERGYARMKRNQAWAHPDEVISIAIDGCENLAHGIPHFPEVTHTCTHTFIPPFLFCCSLFPPVCVWAGQQGRLGRSTQVPLRGWHRAWCPDVLCLRGSGERRPRPKPHL
jgi:hypothetical protein